MSKNFVLETSASYMTKEYDHSMPAKSSYGINNRFYRLLAKSRRYAANYVHNNTPKYYLAMQLSRQSGYDALLH